MKMKMCELCDMNELVSTGTLFPHIRIYATWVSPYRITRNQIDHVLFNKRLRDSVKEDFFGGVGGRSQIFRKGTRGIYLFFLQTKGQEGGCQKILLM